MKHKIRVYDYHDAMHGTPPWNALGRSQGNEDPTVYDVEAWCIGGPNGIRAFFLMDDIMYCASGDNGHWWLVERMHKQWIPKIKQTIDDMIEEMDK